MNPTHQFLSDALLPPIAMVVFVSMAYLNELVSTETDFRTKRAVRVIPITDASIDKSLSQFDKTVGRIEKFLEQEAKTGCVIASWEKNADHEPTCEACDSRTYCPDFTGMNAPRLPGVKNH